MDSCQAEAYTQELNSTDKSGLRYIGNSLMLTVSVATQVGKRACGTIFRWRFAEKRTVVNVKREEGMGLTGFLIRR